MIKIPEFLSMSRKELDGFFSNFDWGGIILDSGCGYKRITQSIEKLGGKVITLDNDKSLRPDIIADARFLPFKNKIIDMLITDGLIEHFDEMDLVRIILEEARVFKKIVINIVPKDTWWNKVLESF